MVEIRQIYYSSETKKNCIFEKLIDNSGKCSVFFENEIISEQIPTMQGSYVGIVSHSFHRKTLFFSQGVREVTEQSVIDWITSNDADCFSFFSKLNNPSTPVLSIAEGYHKGFYSLFKKMVKMIGKEVPSIDTIMPVIYCNHIIARNEIYNDYVINYLNPCIKVLDEADGDFRWQLWQNSKYPRMRNNEYAATIQKNLGLTYLPYHPFLLERLWSYYLWSNDYKLIHW